MKVDIASVNQVGAMEIAAYGGDGCSDIDVFFYDRDSTLNNGSNCRILLQYSDQVPAAHRNIKIRFDVFNPSLSPFFDTFQIFKVDNDGRADFVGRGHVLEGLDISGISDQNDTSCNHVSMVGAFATPDGVSNIHIHDLTGSGGSTESDVILPLGNALTDTILLRNVVLVNQPNFLSKVNITNATGDALFVGCRVSGSLTGSSNDSSPQTYVDCLIGNATAQSYDHKELVRTTVGSRLIGVNSDRDFSVADGTALSLSTYGIVDLMAMVMIVRDGGMGAIYMLQGANHATVELADSSGGFSPTPNNAGTSNIYWDGTQYVLQNKTGVSVRYTVRYLMHQP